jgi:hypothetical protein
VTSAERAKDKRLQTIYNRTLADQNLQRDRQKNACEICRRSFSQFTAYQDHDHACCPRRLKNFCGKCNRGLLCYLCNKRVVAMIEYCRKVEIPIEKAIEYVKNWTAVIEAKGGYVKKEKVTKLRKKQKSI